jgi:hypothetical protein
MSEAGELIYNDGIPIVTEALSLPFPPVSSAWVASWNRFRSIPKFMLRIWTTVDVDLTGLELLGGQAHPFVIADDDVEGVTNGSDLFTIAGHGLLTGDGPIQFTTSDTLPDGVELETDYWIISLSANTFSVATSLKNALAGTAVGLDDDGTGTHTISDTADTRRVHWHSYGLLGQARDGAISLLTDKGYTAHPNHDPGTIAYAIAGTMSDTDPEKVSASVYAMDGTQNVRGG